MSKGMLGARPSSRTISEAVETSNYSTLKKLVEQLEGALAAGAPVGDLVYRLNDISLRSGFLLGRAYEHAMLRGPKRVESGVEAVDTLFERVRRVESRVLSLLGTRPQRGAGASPAAPPSRTPSMGALPLDGQSLRRAAGAGAGRGARARAGRSTGSSARKAETTLIEHWQGLSKDKPIGSFNPRAIARGAKVESEHTGKARSRLARRIAADHLTEDPRYYQKLKKAGLNEGQG